MPTPLSKRTKAEVMEEYNKLLENYENLKMTARVIHEPHSLQLLEKTKDYTANNITNALSSLKTELDNTLHELSEKLLAETQKLTEMQEACELSKKNLEVQYHIQIAAETLQNLINENENKKRELERELLQFMTKVEDAKEKVRREWSREQEEYEYATNVKHKRGEDAHEEIRVKREKELLEREENIKKQEMEIKNLQKQIEDMPKQLERALQGKEVEVIKKLKAEFENKVDFMKKDWEAKEKIYELKTKNLEEGIKKFGAENILLRQEAEKANKKAQELAVKVIESGTKISLKPEEKESSQKPFSQG